MTEQQQAMTREELEAAGYEFDGSQTVTSPDGWSWCSWRDDYVLETATSHYRQQQEIAALREFKRLVEVAAHKDHPHRDPDIINAIFSIQVMKAYDEAFESTGFFRSETVSESERTE